MSAICRRSWRNMSAISTTGARIDRWDNGRLVHRYHARLIETLKLERSSRYLCSEVFITFISNQHDDGADLILAPYSHSRKHRQALRCLGTLHRCTPDAPTFNSRVGTAAVPPSAAFVNEAEPWREWTVLTL